MADVRFYSGVGDSSFVQAVQQAALTPPPSINAPALQSATAMLTLQNIRVAYVQAVDPASATNIANYTLQGNALTVSNVWLINPSLVELSTSPMTPGSKYVLQLSNVRNLGLSATIPPGTQTNVLAPALPVACVRYDAGDTNSEPSGPPDPTSVAGGYWEAQTNATLSDSPITDDVNYSTGLPTGLNAWQVTDYTTASGAYWIYQLPLSPDSQTLARTNGWRLKSRCRMVDGNYGRSAAVVEYCDTGSGRLFSLYFDVDYNNNLTVQLPGAGGSTFTVTSDGSGLDYHTHIMVYEPALGSASYYCDGQFIAANYTGSATLNGNNGLMWGTQASVGEGQMNFNLVEFDTVGGTQPVVTLDPLSTTNGMGQTATFSAAFTPFVAGYQWLSNGVAIPGAFSTNYTTPIILPSINGTVYRCLALSALGNVQTAPATLTILTDTNPPTVTSASLSIYGSRIRLHYSKLMDSTTTPDQSNYTFQGGALAVGSVNQVDYQTLDVFTTTQPVAGSNYVLYISNVSSLDGTVIAPNTAVSLTAISNYPAAGNLIAAFGPAGITNSSLDGATWTDLSGNANHAINPQTNSNARPTRIAGGLNGYDILSFNTNWLQYLYIDGPTSIGLDQQDYTWFTVLHVTNSVGNNAPNVIRHQASPGGTTALNANWGGFFSPTVQQWVVADRNSAGTSIPARAFPVTNGLWYIISGHVDVNQVVSRVLDPVSGVAVAATNATAAAFATTPLATWIGATATGTSPPYYATTTSCFGGEMAEMLLFTGPLADTDTTNIEAYLTAKYFPGPPVLSVTEAGANVRVDFTGVLQSSTNAAGPYVDMPGSPASPYVITPASQQSHQFFRARNP
jgi:hypothetical protein